MKRLISILLFLSIIFANEEIFIKGTKIVNPEKYTKDSIKGISKYGYKAKDSDDLYMHTAYGRDTLLIFDHEIEQYKAAPANFFRVKAKPGTKELLLTCTQKLDAPFTGTLHVVLNRGSDLPKQYIVMQVNIGSQENVNDQITIFDGEKNSFSNIEKEYKKQIEELKDNNRNLKNDYFIRCNSNLLYEESINKSQTIGDVTLTLESLQTLEIDSNYQQSQFIMKSNKIIKEDVPLSVLYQINSIPIDIKIDKYFLYKDDGTNIIINITHKKFLDNVDYKLFIGNFGYTGLINLEMFKTKNNKKFNMGF